MTLAPHQQGIHPTAIIDPGARLGADVSVGPYAVIGPEVEIGDGSWIGPHAVVQGPTTIGKGNKIYQFASVGELSQDMTAKPDDGTRTEIGDHNTIREFVTINRGTLKQDGVTRIGSHNWLMAYVHVAHDCVIGDHTIFANNASLAGHVTIEDWVILGGFTLVHQFCRIGAHAFTAYAAGLSGDVPPFVMVQGNPAKPRSLNLEGLRRRGFKREDVAPIKEAYRVIYRSGKVMDEVKQELAQLANDSEHVARMLRFIESGQRPLQR